MWQPEKETLKIKSFQKRLPTTKTEIISFISTIFDPLGFVMPAVLKPKLIKQELWKRSIEWDEDVPDNLKQRWSKRQVTLLNLKKLNVEEIELGINQVIMWSDSKTAADFVKN